MVGFFFPEQELILYNNQEEKSTKGLSVEYIWKLLSQLPPIQDVPPPKPKKAFSQLLDIKSFQKAGTRILYALHDDGSDSEEGLLANSGSM
jgi:hypothetical protein